MKEARSSIVTSMMRRVCVDVGRELTPTPPIRLVLLDGGGGGDREEGDPANIQSLKFKYTQAVTH